MTVANFKSMVSAIVNRTTTELTVNGIDLLLASINDARRAAQRLHDFELNKTEDAYLSTHFAGADWSTGCKTTPGGSTAVLMKRVDEVWHYTTQAIGATTYYPRTTSIDFSHSARMRREFSRSTSAQSLLTTLNQVPYTEKFAYIQGVNLHITTVTTATIVKLVGIKWLDDLIDASSPDIFLTYFTDWLKWATIGALNMHLKDSERFRLDEVAMSSMWESVKTMDGTIANMGESVDLE
jgi:hypothetical protein